MNKIPLSVILMVFNEEETIAEEVYDYYQIVRKIPGSEIIIAEDGSSDQTRKILRKLAQKIPLRLSVTPQRRGYAKSLRIALEKAKGDFVFYADAGKKHVPSDFWKLYQERDKYDLVSGWKEKRNDPSYRLFLAWSLNFLVRRYFGVNFRDIDSGFKLISKKLLRDLLSQDWFLKNNISLEIVLRSVYLGYSTKEISVKHHARQFGESRGLPPGKIPKVVFSLLKNFPRLKKIIKQQSLKQNSMLDGYNRMFPTGFYREMWEGEISVSYKLPKYIMVIKNFLAGHKKDLKVLEVGCGDGEIAEIFLKDKNLPIASYTGIDLSDGAIKQAKNVLAGYNNVSLARMDTTKLAFGNNSFDSVVCFDVMHHVEKPRQMAQELIRIAKRDILLIEANGLSIARKLAEKQKRYQEMGEKSYYPWEYRSFFTDSKVKKITLKPFLFMFPHCPKYLIKLNIVLSEMMEKTPFFNWQCSGIIIKIDLHNKL